MVGSPAGLATRSALRRSMDNMPRGGVVPHAMGAAVAMAAPVTARKAGRQGTCGDQEYRELLHRFPPQDSSHRQRRQDCFLLGLFPTPVLTPRSRYILAPRAEPSDRREPCYFACDGKNRSMSAMVCSTSAVSSGCSIKSTSRLPRFFRSVGRCLAAMPARYSTSVLAHGSVGSAHPSKRSPTPVSSQPQTPEAPWQ